MSARKKKKSLWKRILRKLMFLVTLTLVLLAGSLLFFYIKYNKQLSEYGREANLIVENSSIDSFKQELNGKILYDDGKLLSYLKAGKNVHYLDFEEIPEQVIDAFIAVEDRRFYKHNGIDKKGILRVLFHYVRSKGKRMAGASTITQQLSRNIFLTHEVSFERKVKEAFIALNLEKKYSKNQILEFYINNIYFGNGYYGIGAAAKGYFNKSAKKLSLSQVAYLAAIPNNPSHYNPLEHSDRTLLRRDKILRDMMKEGYIAQGEYDKAIAEKIKIKQSKNRTNDYETTYAIECAIRYLMEEQGFKTRQFFNNKKDYEDYLEEYHEIYEQCRQRLYTEGYEIHTSINKEAQSLAQKQVDEILKFSKDKKKNEVYSFQGAVTCVDNSTGKVIAVIGGRKQSGIGGLTLNRAFQSYRQPGSAIKPLVVYTPSLENGYTAETIVDDVKIKDGPANSGKSYLGRIALSTAVHKSKNVVAWTLMEELTPRTGLSYVQEMLFKKIVPSDYVNSSALGGLTYGVTTEEMAGAYATLANSGIFNEPTCILSMKQDGKEIYKKREGKRIYSKAASQEMTAILRGVLTQGTAAKIGWRNKSIQAAAKTGTTNDSKDGWFCGYTPYYTIAVWVGYDEPKTMSGLWGSSYPAAIWKNIMSALVAGKSSAAFDTSFVGGEKNPTKISEYALANTPSKNEKETENLIHSLEVFLDSLENLEAGKTEKADSILKAANTVLSKIEEEDIKAEYAERLQSAYEDYLNKEIELPEEEPDIKDEVQNLPEDDKQGIQDGSGEEPVILDETAEDVSDTVVQEEEPVVEEEEPTMVEEEEVLEPVN